MKREDTISIKALQGKLISPLALASPSNDRKYTLVTDAYNALVGCVLLRKQEDGTHQLIGNLLHSLNDARRSYDIANRKSYLVLWAVLLFPPYLEDTKFTIRTDNASSKRILNLADGTVMLARWLLRSALYGFDINYRSGVKRASCRRSIKTENRRQRLH